MSISVVLVPLAIALTATLTDESLARLKMHKKLSEKLEPLQTKFTNDELLTKTLQEHGFPVREVSENHVVAKAGKSELNYQRNNVSEAFSVTATGWDNVDDLIFDVECLEKEYLSNVQSYTYNKLIQNLSDSGMTIEDEVVLEDNSILLTINI